MGDLTSQGSCTTEIIACCVFAQLFGQNHRRNYTALFLYQESSCKFFEFSESTAFSSRSVAASVNNGAIKNCAKISNASSKKSF